MKFIEAFEILKSAIVMEKLTADPLKEIYAYRKDYGDNREDNCLPTQNKSEIRPFLIKFNQHDVLTIFEPAKFPFGSNNCNRIIIQQSHSMPITIDIFEYNDWEIVTREEIMKDNFLW